ncbi:MAG TPA: type II secretion system minor pseudopilin GspK [Casimicrobiaceae bacterium]
MQMQRGAALIIAMVIAALAATVAMSLAANQQQWFASMVNRRDQVQAQALAQAGVQWARQILFEDARTTAIDTLIEPWALPLPATPLENGSVEGRIIDAQGLLNVNNLASADADVAAERARFERLFTRLGLPPTSIDAIADWIDADSVARPNGAEDGWYAQQSNPMLAANGPVVRTAEIALVRGMSPAAVKALSPYVIALPAPTKLNVNTASGPVLAASVDGLDATGLSALLASRAQKPFAKVSDFTSGLPQGATVKSEALFDVSSKYFLVTVVARQGDTRAQARALLERTRGTWPTIVWQTSE